MYIFIKSDLRAANISRDNIWTVELMVIWVFFQFFFFMPLCIFQVLNYKQ